MPFWHSKAQLHVFRRIVLPGAFTVTSRIHGTYRPYGTPREDGMVLAFPSPDVPARTGHNHFAAARFTTEHRTRPVAARAPAAPIRDVQKGDQTWQRKKSSALTWERRI